MSIDLVNHRVESDQTIASVQEPAQRLPWSNRMPGRQLIDQFEMVAQPLLRRFSIPMLRVALGLLFVWFGALKVTGATPVGDLVANTVPFIDAGLLVPALGAFEVVLGLVLISGRLLGWSIAAMVAHLAGTFLVFVTQPQVAYVDGNPLLVSMEGEFVAKNVVLITAGLAVAAFSRRGLSTDERA